MLLSEENEPTSTAIAPTDGNAALETQEEPTDEAPDELRTALADYWALKPTSECIEMLTKKSTEYYNYCNATGKMALWRLSFEQYNRGFLTMASLSRGGLEGEIIQFPVNEFRNVVDHVVGMTLQEKLAFEAQPTNNDYKTNAQMTLAENLLAYYSKHKGMDTSVEQTSYNSYLFGEGSVLKLWDENIGDIKAVDSKAQKIYRKGDVTFIELNPTNLIRDVHVKNFKDNLWFIARLFVNKWELAAKYPTQAKAILDRGMMHDWDNTRLTVGNDTDSDLVPLYMWFYKPTIALPFGRRIYYIDKDVWLEDGHLKYAELPIYTQMPSPTESLNHGYTVAFDLLPLQQMLDILDSAIATNNTNFAMTNILVPDDCNLGVADIIGSMNLLKYNPKAGEPKPLELLLTPKEVYEFRQQIVQWMEVLAGINSIIRGQDGENMASGAAMALKASQAIHFNSRFQKSYIDFAGRLATGVIKDLQAHPEEKRTGLIAGKANRAYLKEFYGKDVDSIDRIIASVGSAFIQTDAGKLQMAQDLIGSGLIKNPQEYIEVLKTGTVDAILEGQHKQLMRIKQENEALASGQKVKAAITDDHVTDVLEHANVISDPDIRNSTDPSVIAVVENTLAHIKEHLDLLAQMPPALAAILKLPVLNTGNATPPPAAPPPAQTPGGPAMPKAVPQQKVPVKPGMTPGGSVALPPPAASPIPVHPGVK